MLALKRGIYRFSEYLGRGLANSVDETLSAIKVITLVLGSLSNLTKKSKRQIFYRFFFSRIANVTTQIAPSVLILSLLITATIGFGFSKQASKLVEHDLLPILGMGSGYFFNIVAYELAPLLVGMIFITSSGASMTAEIAQRKLRNEFATFRSLGIDPVFLFLLPVLLVYPFLMVVSIIYFDLISIFSYHLSIGQLDLFYDKGYTYYFSQTLSEKGFIVSIIKMIFGGLIIAIISINHGTRIQMANSGLPIVISNSTASQLIFFVSINAIISIIGYLI